MKLQKLHKKILFASVVILIFSEILVFFMFRKIAIRSIYDAGHDYVSYRVIEFKVLMEEKLSGKTIASIKTDRSLEHFFDDLDRQYKARFLLLASDDSRLMTGQTLVVDAGVWMNG